MTFSSLVKKEIYTAFGAANADARHCRVAMLSAIIASGARVKTQVKTGSENLCNLKVVLAAENRYLLRTFYDICRNDFQAVLHGQKSEGKIRSLSLEKEDEGIKILGVVGLWNENTGFERKIGSLALRGDCCRRAYLAGTLLTCGYLSDPESMYHAEFRVNDPKYARELVDFFKSFGLNAHMFSRKDRRTRLIYFKDGEQISEILRITGAHEALMRFENARILKSLGNKINRSANFDAANVDKAISAAVKQIESINLIKGGLGLNSLPPGLEELARLRLKYPEMSLTELGEMLNPSLSKSGVNHRLRKLKEIADRLGDG